MEPVKVGEYLDDPRVELQRKVAVLRVVAIVEAVTYALLLIPMYEKWIAGNRSDWVYFAIRVMGFFHGFIWLTYTYFAWDVHRALGWTKEFLALVVVPPILGGIICHLRLRRDAASV